jgi:hypothetical protein
MDAGDSEPNSAEQRLVGNTAHQHPAESVLQMYVRQFDRVQREMGRIIQSANQALQSGAQAMQSTARALQGASLAWPDILQTLQKSFKAAQKRWEYFLRELPAKIRASLVGVARHGWFLDSNMPFTGFGKLEKAFQEGNEEMAQEALVSYYRERLPAIRAKLQDNHPQRTAILDQAFSAHLRGEYALSTAVFLAQADGICHELFGASPFRRRDGKPATAGRIDQAVAQGFASEFLCLLSCPLPISANETERGNDFTELNRHQVLHGESLDYGTETNSLKAISFLNYVGDYVTKTVRAEASRKAPSPPES